MAATIRTPAMATSSTVRATASPARATRAVLAPAGARAPGLSRAIRVESSFMGSRVLGSATLPVRPRKASFATRAQAPGPEGTVKVKADAKPGPLSPEAQALLEEAEKKKAENKKKWAREEERNKKRSVFGPDDWKRHREIGRYNRNMLSMTQSRIVEAAGGPVLVMSAISCVAAYLDQMKQAGNYPAELANIFAIPATPFALTGASIGLLLVFRTNSAYGRWWEARKLWGLLINRSRDLTRQSLGYMTDPKDVLLADQLARYTSCVSKTLMCHLRTPEEHNVEEETKTLLKPNEIALLSRSAHRPNHILQVMTEAVRNSQLDSMQKNLLDHNITTFADVVGACERIYKTPIPLSYTRHTARILMIWLAFLPFGIADACHWATVPVVAFTTFLLIGIDELGIEIEEPFSILPLEVMANTIETNIVELMKRNAAINGRPLGLPSADYVGVAADVTPAVNNTPIPPPARSATEAAASPAAAAAAVMPEPVTSADDEAARAAKEKQLKDLISQAEAARKLKEEQVRALLERARARE